MSPDPDDFRAGVGYRLLQLARQWRRIDEKAMVRLGYNDVSWVPLVHLYGAAPMMQKELAARCGLDTSSLVRLLTPLTEQGLLDRLPNPDDGRAWLLKLTESGQEQARKITDVITRTEAAMLRDIPSERVDALMQTTRRIEENMAALDDEGEHD